MRDVTELLEEWSRGDRGAFDALVPLVYDDLRRRAHGLLRREHHHHPLQTTELVHEAYLKLVDQDRANWKTRGQFLAVAAEVMRRVLVDLWPRGGGRITGLPSTWTPRLMSPIVSVNLDTPANVAYRPLRGCLESSHRIRTCGFSVVRRRRSSDRSRRCMWAVLRGVSSSSAQAGRETQPG